MQDLMSENSELDVKPTILDLPTSMKQGWGLSHDTRGRLYVSDGSDQIKVVDLRTMETVDRITVRDELGDQPILNLNELEVVDDKWIFANQYTENVVYQIRISTGRVVKSWDLSALQWRQKELVLDKNDVWNSRDDKNDVLNGIAYRKSTDTFFVTGSMWDLITEIKLQYIKQ